MADEEEEYEQEFDASEDEAPPPRPPSESSFSAVSESAPPSPLQASYSSHVVLQQVHAAASPSSDVHAPPRRAKTAAKKKPIRSVLDQSPWTYTVHAKRIRSLRIPVASSALSTSARGADGRVSMGFPAIRDLRVFGVVDKQSMQSHGSRWKQEARVAEAARPTVSSRRSPSNATTTSSPGRRSGFFEEAQWKNNDGELQWTSTLDRFRKLKAYSPRIKLFVFGIGVNAPADSVRSLSEDSPRQYKESIVSLGWFFLDLRTPDLPERWFKLQNSPFGGEILVSTTHLPMDLNRAAHTSSSLETRAAVAARRREHLFVAGSDCLRIGDHGGSDVFLVSVFLQGAASLASVVQSAVGSKDQERKARQAGFWLSYSLFDVVVQTDVFYNLDRAEFASIRDSFRVMSRKVDLRAFLETHRVLSIYLCTQDRVLASVELPFHELLDQEAFFAPTTAAAGQPTQDQVAVSGTFAFAASAGDGSGIAASFCIEHVETVSVKHDEEELKHESDDKMELDQKQDSDTIDRGKQAARLPSVITVGFVKLSSGALAMYAGKEAIELEVVYGEQAVRGPIHFSTFTADYALGNCPDLALQVDLQAHDPAQLSVSCYSSATDRNIASSPIDTGNSSKRSDGGQLQLTLLSSDGQRVGQCVLVTQPAADEKKEKMASREELRSIPGLSHTYRVLIRLTALRDFETSRPVVISYTNPFTGHECVETPLLSVTRKAESSISDAYCVFELHRDETSLKDAMESPLVMDVSLALPDGSRETVGSAIFSLNFLFYSEQGMCCAESSCDAVFQTRDEADAHWDDTHGDPSVNVPRPVAHSIKTCSIYVPVMSNGQAPSTRRVGALQVEACIEDVGPLSEEDVRLVEEMRVSPMVHASQHRTGFEKTEASRLCGIQEASRRNGSVDSTSSREKAMNTSSRADGGAAESHTHFSSNHKELDELRASIRKERSTWLQEQNVQQSHWKKRVAQMEQVRMDELEEEWARREEERSAVLKAAQTEYQKLEQKLRVTLAEVELRERKLALAESAVERDQRMLREDTDLLRKRLQSEQSHSVSLAQKQVDALEKRVVELQAHLQAAEKRAFQVEEDFVEYRKQQRKVPESKLREEIASLKGQVAELEKMKFAETRAKEHAEANVEKMKTQLEKMAKLVQAEKKKNESRVVDELEKLRLKYVAREERYVLDGDREELRAIKKQLDELRHVHVRGHDSVAVEDARRVKRNRARVGPCVSSPDVASPRSPGSMATASPTRRDGRRHSWSSAEVDSMQMSPSATSPLYPEAAFRRAGAVRNENRPLNQRFDDKELRRLERERESLLASGVYDHDSYLVRELARRIVLRQDQLAQQ